jgi:hypothetical protein
MTALITREPCEHCEDIGRETETGAWYCKASPSGDQECERTYAVAELVGKALAAAEHYAKRIRHTPDAVKREAIEGEAGVYEEWAQAIGAEFDSEAFVRACGLLAKVAV